MFYFFVGFLGLFWFINLSVLCFSHLLLLLRQFQNNIPQVRKREERERWRRRRRRRWRWRQRVGLNGSQCTESRDRRAVEPMRVPIANSSLALRPPGTLSLSLSVSWSACATDSWLGPRPTRSLSCCKPTHAMALHDKNAKQKQTLCSLSSSRSLSKRERVKKSTVRVRVRAREIIIIETSSSGIEQLALLSVSFT